MTTTVANRDSFDRFGNDLVEVLVSYLLIEDKLRYQLVSKQWRRLVFNKQTDLIIDNELNNCIKLKTILKKFSDIKRVVFLSVITDDHLDLLINYCPKLTNVYFDNFHENCLILSKVMINKFYDKFGTQLLTFRSDFNELLIPFVKYLQTIDKEIDRKLMYISLNDNDIQLIFNDNIDCVLPETIHTIETYLTDISMPLFVKFSQEYHRNIKSIDLHLKGYLDDISFDSFTISLSQMTELKHLSLFVDEDDLCFHDNPDANYMVNLLNELANNCLKLKSLEIVLEPDIYDISDGKSMLDAIVRMKQLRRLSITGLDCDLITSYSLQSLKLLKHLTLFGVEYDVIGDKFFADIDQHLPRLEYLFLEFVAITSAGHNCLLQLPHLKNVNFIEYSIDNNEVIDGTIITKVVDDKVRHIKFGP